MSPIIQRDDLPPTPDWYDPRCDCPEARIDHFTGNPVEVSPAAKMTFDEALSLWDRNWAHWAGDDG